MATPPHGNDNDLGLAALLLLSDFGPTVLPFLTTKEANHLRATCAAARTAVAAFPWHDGLTPIRGPPKAWKVCFPNARAVNLYYRRDLVLADLHDLFKDMDVRELACAGVPLMVLTDTAWAYFPNVERLDLRASYPCVLATKNLKDSLPKLRHIVLSPDQGDACAAELRAAGVEVVVQDKCVNCKRFPLNQQLNFFKDAGKPSCETRAPTRGYCDACFSRRRCRRCKDVRCAECSIGGGIQMGLCLRCDYSRLTRMYPT